MNIIKYMQLNCMTILISASNMRVLRREAATTDTHLTLTEVTIDSYRHLDVETQCTPLNLLNGDTRIELSNQKKFVVNTIVR